MLKIYKCNNQKNSHFGNRQKEKKNHLLSQRVEKGHLLQIFKIILS